MPQDESQSSILGALTNCLADRQRFELVANFKISLQSKFTAIDS